MVVIVQHYIVQIGWYNTIKYNSQVGCTNLIYQVHTTLDQFDCTPIEVGCFLLEIARAPQGLPIQMLSQNHCSNSKKGKKTIPEEEAQPSLTKTSFPNTVCLSSTHCLTPTPFLC